MKKRIIQFIITMLVIAPFALSAQQKTAIDGLYDKYAGKEGFTTISITPEMFEMLANMNMSDSSQEAKEAQEAMKQLKGLKMLVFDAEDSIKTMDFYKEMKKSLPSDKYKEIMTVNSDDGVVHFMVNQAPNGKVQEFLMFVTGDHGESVVMNMTGNIDMKTISEIGSAVNMPGMNNLKKMHDVSEK